MPVPGVYLSEEQLWRDIATRSTKRDRSPHPQMKQFANPDWKQIFRLIAKRVMKNFRDQERYA